MFINRIHKAFAPGEPIFSSELLVLFSDYSRAQVFRFVKNAKERGELIKYCKGVYFLPEITQWGDITITAEDVIRKRYLKNGSDVYGVYSGIKLLNTFSVTTQMAGIVEIITNNEASRYREIEINNRRYVLRKSRCNIDKTNAAAYTIMQLFNDMGKEYELDDSSLRKLQSYIKKENVTQEQLLALTKVFPARTTQKLIGSGLYNTISSKM